MDDHLNTAEGQGEPTAKNASTWRTRSRRWAVKALRIARQGFEASAIAAAVLSVIVIVTPLGDLWADALTHIDPLQKADYIVVLGGGRHRAAEAARLFSDGWADKVIVSSFQDDADTLATLVQAYGVGEDKIIIDRCSNSTSAHPNAIGRLEGVDRTSQGFIIVTSRVHTKRVRTCFSNRGYPMTCMRGPGWDIGGGIVPDRRSWLTRARTLPVMARETAAWIWYSLNGKLGN